MTTSRSNKVLLLLCITGALTIVATLLIYIYKFGSFSLSSQKEHWDLFSTYLGGTLGPIISVITLVITSYIAYRFNEYQVEQQKIKDAEQLQQTTIELFRQWRAPSVLRARTDAWSVKRKWEANLSFRPIFIEAMVMECETNDLSEELSVSKKEFRAMYDLFAFYNMLSLYSSNQQNIKNLNYFSYPWWRHFLYEVAIAFDAMKMPFVFDKTLKNEELHMDFAANISFVSYLQRLDEICGFNKIDDPTNGQIFEFYKKPYG